MEYSYEIKQLISEKEVFLTRIKDCEKQEKEIDEKLKKYENLFSDNVKPELIEEAIKQELSSIESNLARYKQADSEFLKYIKKTKDNIDKEYKYFNKSVNETFKKYWDSTSISKILKTQLREFYNRYIDVLKKSYKEVIKEMSKNKAISCKATYEAYLLLCNIRDKMGKSNIDIVKKNDFIVTIVPESMKQTIDEIKESILSTDYSFLFELKKKEELEKNRKDKINTDIKKYKSEIKECTAKIKELSKPSKTKYGYFSRQIDYLKEENKKLNNEKIKLIKELDYIAEKQKAQIGENIEIINSKQVAIENYSHRISNYKLERENNNDIKNYLSQIEEKQLELHKLRNEKSECNSNMLQLGLFSFKDKKELQDKIDQLDLEIESIINNIDSVRKKVESIKQDYSNKIVELEIEINSLKKEIDIQNNLIENKKKTINYDDAILKDKTRIKNIGIIIGKNCEDILKYKKKVENDEKLTIKKNKSSLKEKETLNKKIEHCKKEILKLEKEIANVHKVSLCEDYLSMCKKRVQPIVKQLKIDKKQINKDIKDLNNSIKTIDSKVKDYNKLNSINSNKKIDKKENSFDIGSIKKSNDIFGIKDNDVKPAIMTNTQITTNGNIEKKISDICVLKGKKIISNILFKIYVNQTRKIDNSFDIWFEDENMNLISVKRTIDVSLNEDLPIGISLLSNVDFTNIKKCWCVLDFGDGELYKTEFEVSISFHLDF